MPGIQNSKGVLSFLDSVGNNDRGDVVEFSHTAAALRDLAELIISNAQDNLKKDGNVASGKTAASLKAGPLQTNATRLQIDITADSNYKYLNDGVKGVEGGSGKYSFQTKHPSKKMALAILKWIKIRRVATKYKAAKGKEGKNERKNQRIKRLSAKAESQKALAYAIATNIKKKGIKPTRFFSKAVKFAKSEQKKSLAKAIKIDIIEMFS